MYTWTASSRFLFWILLRRKRNATKTRRRKRTDPVTPPATATLDVSDFSLRPLSDASVILGIPGYRTSFRYSASLIATSFTAWILMLYDAKSSMKMNRTEIHGVKFCFCSMCSYYQHCI